MSSRFRRLLYAWVALLGLLAVELGLTALPFGRPLRPVILFPALLMVGIVGVMFMRVSHGPIIVRGFAVAALFWLAVLLGLGSLDPLTRTDYPVIGVRVN